MKIPSLAPRIESGFYYLQSRYYDPQIGRFINADAAEYSSMSANGINDTNLFVYCRNNPISNGDDDGELPTALIGALIGGVLSAGAEIASQLIDGATFDTLNGAKIAGEFVGGFVTGGLIGLGLNKTAANVVGTVIKSVSYGAIAKKSASETLKLTVVNVTKSLASEVVGNTIGKAGQKLFSNYKSNRGISFFAGDFYKGKHVANGNGTRLVNVVQNGISNVYASLRYATLRRFMRYLK